MAVIKENIAVRIKQLIQSNKNEEDLDKAVNEFANELSEIISDAIVNATVSATPGSIVVVGGPTTQTNAIPIIFQIT